jgi:hypothetical protein
VALARVMSDNNDGNDDGKGKGGSDEGDYDDGKGKGGSACPW